MEENLEGNSSSETPRTKTCPFCSEQVNIDAKKCKHCGEFLDIALREIEMLKKNQGGANPVIVNNNNNNNNNNGGDHNEEFY